MPSKIQSVVFPKSKFKLKDAIEFLKRNKFKTRLDSTKTQLKFRQEDPKKFKRMRTKKLKSGIMFVIGFY